MEPDPFDTPSLPGRSIVDLEQYLQVEPAWVTLRQGEGSDFRQLETYALAAVKGSTFDPDIGQHMTDTHSFVRSVIEIGAGVLVAHAAGKLFSTVASTPVSIHDELAQSPTVNHMLRST